MAKLPENIDYGFCNLHLKDRGLSAGAKGLIWTVDVKVERRPFRMFVFKYSYRFLCFISRICGVPPKVISELFDQRQYLQDMGKI